MAAYQNGIEAKDGNIVRGPDLTGRRIVQGMLADIKPDGTGTVTWITSTKGEKGFEGFISIGTDSAVVKLSECKKVAESLLEDVADKDAFISLDGADEAKSAAEPRLFSPEAGLLFRGRLTKGVAMTLPEGSIVQSNVFHDRWTPKAVETVGSPEDRVGLWKRLRSLGVTNITCNVWRDFDAYQHFAKRWGTRAQSA